MQLTDEQVEAIRDGGSVRLRQGDTEVVVLRADVFERLLQYDAGAWTDDEMDRLAAEDADALGWEGMDAYQDEEA